MKKERIHFLDEIRGFAVICMVVHHLFYSIGYVLDLQWGYDAFDFFCIVQPIFWAIFIVTSGICVQLSRNSVKRGGIVFAFSLVITFVTAVIMPLISFEGEEIYFGVLHCLGICMIICGLLKKTLAKVNTKVGAAVSILLFTVTYNVQNGYLFFDKYLRIDLPANWYSYNFLFPFGITSGSFHSADYFPLFPWLFLFVFGSFIGRFALERRFPEFMYKSHSKFLQLAGKNSLWVYILHQPMIFAVLVPISYFFNI